MALTLSELARRLGLEFSGEPDLVIEAVASLESAGPSDLCFVQSAKYLGQLAACNGGAVIVPSDLQSEPPCRAMIHAANPHLAFVQAIHLLYPQPVAGPDVRIGPGAQVDPTARLGAGVSIGANSVVGANVVIGERVRIGPGCVIQTGARLGDDCELKANVTLGHGVSLGCEVILHSGAVIGSDGFGLVPDGESWVKIPHLGSVRVGDRVEIGANTTVDRGALDDTVIENGVKLDNLIQVAHNVRIGENTAIAACVGIAGSAIIGKNCKISGAAVVLGHLSLADNVTVTAMSLVTKSIRQAGTYSSGTPLMENAQWHRSNVRYKALDKLAGSIASLEKKMKTQSD